MGGSHLPRAQPFAAGLAQQDSAHLTSDTPERLNWHRSATKSEVKLILLLLGANFFMLFVTIAAEDPWKKEQAAAKKEGRPPVPNNSLITLWRNFEVNTYNLMAGLPHPLLLASFRHGGEVHLMVNMAFLMAVAPGVLAALGPRRFLGLYLAAGAVGFLAEITFWDFIHPLLMGQQPHPSRAVLAAQLHRMERAQKAGMELQPHEILSDK